MLLHIVAGIVGAALVLVTVVDALGTLIVTQGTTARWRPTRIFYSWTWRFWRWTGKQISSPARRERFLSVYGPLSLIALLLIWLTCLLFGWSLVYVSLDGQFEGPRDYGDALYFSQTSLLTVGPAGPSHSIALHLLTLVETISGLGTVALLVGYLPALYGSYSKREARLLTLDHPSGQRITPGAVIMTHAPGGDVALLYRFFAEWELWTAEVLESHVSYPMLAFFRSQHAGQSWITALGVVLDAASLTCAVIPGADVREPYFMHRRGRRSLTEIGGRLHVQPKILESAALDADRMRFAYDRLQETGLELRPFEDSLMRLGELRAGYEAELEALIDELEAPRGFWGDSAVTIEDSVA